jgi:hypothetical protein
MPAAATAGGVRFREMVPADLGQVARLHRQHFPDGYYVRLGSAPSDEFVEDLALEVVSSEVSGVAPLDEPSAG